MLKIYKSWYFFYREWYPIVEYNKYTVVFVSKISESKLAGVEHINEAKIFNGQTNPVILTQEITTTFDCDLYLLYYPFDSQECYIQVSDSLLGFNYK